MSDAPRPCDPHPDIVGFKYPLPHLTESLRRRRKTRIVAIGSSSTAGEKSPTGEIKIVPFPYRLELALRGHNYGRLIDVLNRGIGGQEAPEELSRFEPDVIGEAPALVIWQVGTNAVFHNEVYSPDEVIAAIAVGLDWLSGLALDVVMMDLQYTTAVVEPDDKLKLSEKMVERISAAAGKAHVNVFRRFELMRQWCLKDNIPIADLIDPEDPSRLHMSDWATNCVTQALYGAIAGAQGAIG
jgi:acyl-CoA thioesterase-1